jgi:uncharacterized MAPEG superfamily protein
MRTEIYVLIFAIALGLIHIFIAVAASTRQRGAKWNISARDATVAPLTGVAARLDRALQNFKETFPLFLAAVVVVVATNTIGTLSEIGCYTYLFARAAYLPVYAFGIPVVRSLLWLASVVGIVLIVAQVFVA